MKLRINDCLIHLESLSDENLMNLVFALQEKKTDIDNQLAALAAERFSRRQSPLPLGR